MKIKAIKKSLKAALLAPLAVTVLVLASCEYLTPTVVPPLTKELGYSVPSISGVTTTGLIRSAYEYHIQKTRLWKYSVDATLDLTAKARGQIMDLITVVGLGGTAALPAALRRLPKGARTQKEYERAGAMDPSEFRAGEDKPA